MKYVIDDLDKFENLVFGADDLIDFYPELTSTGIILIKQGSLYYIANDNNEIINDSSFFNEEEMTCLKPV